RERCLAFAERRLVVREVERAAQLFPLRLWRLRRGPSPHRLPQLSFAQERLVDQPRLRRALFLPLLFLLHRPPPLFRLRLSGVRHRPLLFLRLDELVLRRRGAWLHRRHPGGLLLRELRLRLYQLWPWPVLPLPRVVLRR